MRFPQKGGNPDMSSRSAPKSFFGTALKLLKQTAQEWLPDKAPQLGAALAYYTVFSLAPLILGLCQRIRIASSIKKRNCCAGPPVRQLSKSTTG
jgi:membrane protein